MNLIYNTGIGLYSFAAKLVSLRSEKVKKMLAGQKATLAAEPASEGYDVWFHAASLGEFEQARPMIERLKRERPAMKILLTFFSPSGYEVRKNYDKVDRVAYLPFDTPGRVKKFLDTFKPRMAVFVKYEFWGNYMQQLRQHGIPTYLISGIFRPSQAFFKWYGGMMRGVLRNFDKLYIQDEASKALLASIGIDNVEVAGDTRFDRVTDVMRSTVEFPILEEWLSGEKALIAGSSWGPDEDCYIPYLNQKGSALKAIIAPHEFDDERLATIIKRIDGKAMLFSEAEKEGKIPEDVQVVIIDSFGKLSSLYRYGKVAIIGGGFGTGIHNINEAAVYGMPVVFGPNNKKFKEAADLKACGGGFEYTTAAELAAILDQLLADPAALSQAGAAAGAYIADHIGATDQIYPQLFLNLHSI